MRGEIPPHGALMQQHKRDRCSCARFFDCDVASAVPSDVASGPVVGRVRQHAPPDADGFWVTTFIEALAPQAIRGLIRGSTQ